MSELPTIPNGNEYQCLAIEQSNLATGLFAISDSECEVCADGYQFWPCNVSPPLCICGTTFTDTPSKSPTVSPSQSPTSGPSQEPSNEVRKFILCVCFNEQKSLTSIMFLPYRYSQHQALLNLLQRALANHRRVIHQPVRVKLQVNLLRPCQLELRQMG